jgi:hypothetical protein
MKLNKIYGIILSAVGAVDTYAGFTMLTSNGAKIANKIGFKPSMLAIAILATGIGLLALGLMKLFVEKK